ncbi:CHASE2 domain-containing protein [Ancylothrix sp. D3o]|uniref:CHASE2 domain-containing protein n=1 Tax=Ancylothrix sp. D3o TaxID=2953691 RepID=UPI0021BB4881|nr:adenylate/guanylate cyclase domain-containing protein [Ancylothrix sp. D3o]
MSSSLIAKLSKIQSSLTGLQSLIPGVVAASVSVGMWGVGAWQPLEQVGYNTLFEMRNAGVLPHSGWNENIVVIAIDNSSLEKYGQFPWKRSRYAELLKALKSSQPQAIGFDILFAEKSDQDGEFVEEIRKSGKVVLATAWDGKGKAIKVIPEFEKAAAGIGQIWHNPDEDGISRRAAIFVKEVPSLAVAMLQVENQKVRLAGALDWESRTTSFQLQCSLNEKELAAKIPQAIKGKKREIIWLNWPEKAEKLPTYSFKDVVEGKVSPAVFQDKFVLVGMTATGFDPVRSPLNRKPPINGVYLHAVVIDNLLGSKELKPLDEVKIIILLVAIALLTSWVWYRRGLKARLAMAVGVPVLWLAMALSAFCCSNIWVPVAAPMGSLLMAGFGVQVRDYYERLRERHEKELLMTLFEKYLAPETANMIWERKSELFEEGMLKAQEQIATVLFMDIRGFTSISEKMKPKELFIWLNRYLEAMSGCIMDHGGVVDKYIGDAIMAVFGVPFARTTQEEIRQDALNAMAACFAMNKKLKELNKSLRKQQKPEIKIGIGIHTGAVMAGSLGGERRLNYSVVGDTVNVAARLEAFNKEVTADNPYQLLVSGKTFRYVRNFYVGKPVGVTQLRGRKQETVIYSILGRNKKSISPQPS